MMISPPYKHTDLQTAYDAWVNTPTYRTDERLRLFEFYVDVRDGLPLGTTALRRLERAPVGDERVIILDLDG